VALRGFVPDATWKDAVARYLDGTKCTPG
jgi:uncharacterized membrane protein